MAIKKFEDNSGNGFTKNSSTDLSNLTNGLNPFGESMAAGNTIAQKGSFQAQGSDSEAPFDAANSEKTYNASNLLDGSENVNLNKNKVK